MKILVFGAGVLGSCLCHELLKNGNEVELFARGKRKDELLENGLVIYHYLQKRTTVDRPKIIGEIDPKTHYDAAFSVMQYGQTKAALGQLSEINAPVLVLVGNNLSCSEMAEYLNEHGLEHGEKRSVLFGFSAVGGRRENGRVVCIKKKGSAFHCGAAGGKAPEEAKAALEKALCGEYKPQWEEDMDAWLKCHAAFILPIAYLSYASGCDLRKSTAAQRRLCLDATGEAYSLLSLLGFPILPRGDEEYFKSGAKLLYMKLFMLALAKTKLGELAATDHCRAAVCEMEELDSEFERLRRKKPGFSMPAFERLRKSAPSREELKKIYCGK